MKIELCSSYQTELEFDRGLTQLATEEAGLSAGAAKLTSTRSMIKQGKAIVQTQIVQTQLEQLRSHKAD
jgi:hypothetical protein